MADKDFKVKNKLFVNGLSQASGVVLSTNNNLDAHTNLPTQFGGTGTTTSPSAGQLLYSSSGSTYAPVSPSIIPGIYARGNTASRPASPAVGDLYFNTELNYFESYTSNGWFPIAAAPLAPTGVTATNQGSGRAFNNGQASVAFSPNTSGGAPTSFILTPSPSTSPTTFTGSSSPIIVTGLQSSTQYTYTVQSTSPYGTSAASAASAGVTATTVPQAPTIGTAISTVSQQASVTFTPGATGGAAATYTAISNPGNITASGASSPITVTGLTNGTSYTFTVTATNANGTSLASAASNSVTPVLDPGSMYPIGTFTLASAQSNVEFTNIPQTYTHLQLRYIGRDLFSGSGINNVTLRCNGLSANTNYTRHNLSGDGTNAYSQGSGSGEFSTFFPGGSVANGSAANTFATEIIDILDYRNTNKNKTIRILGGADINGAGVICLSSMLFMNTNPITSISLLVAGHNWAANSSFALYGVQA